MNKLVDKIKGIISKINIFDEGKDDNIPETVPGIAKCIARTDGYGSVQEIEAILREGKNAIQRQAPQMGKKPKKESDIKEIQQDRPNKQIARNNNREVNGAERDDR